MVSHQINIPDWLELLLSLPILTYRRLRFGCAFRRIPLTKGKFALVSPRDYPAMMKYKWSAHRAPYTYYAIGNKKINGINKTVSMHRELMKPLHGLIVDHIDGNGLNNCRPNLRLANKAENNRNSRRQKNNRSKYKGVRKTFEKKPWRARITVNYKGINLGSYDTENDAAKAYDKAAMKYFGRFARLNFPPKRFDFKRAIKNLRKLQQR